MSAVLCDVARCGRPATIAVTFTTGTSRWCVCDRHDARQSTLNERGWRGRGWLPYQISRVDVLGPYRPESVE